MPNRRKTGQTFMEVMVLIAFIALTVICAAAALKLGDVESPATEEVEAGHEAIAAGPDHPTLEAGAPSAPAHTAHEGAP